MFSQRRDVADSMGLRQATDDLYRSLDIDDDWEERNEECGQHRLVAMLLRRTRRGDMGGKRNRSSVRTLHRGQVVESSFVSFVVVERFLVVLDDAGLLRSTFIELRVIGVTIVRRTDLAILVGFLSLRVFVVGVARHA